jgi:hypothetical protein
VLVHKPEENKDAGISVREEGSAVDSGHRREPVRADCTRGGGYGRTGQYDSAIAGDDDVAADGYRWLCLSGQARCHWWH